MHPDRSRTSRPLAVALAAMYDGHQPEGQRSKGAGRRGPRVSRLVVVRSPERRAPADVYLLRPPRSGTRSLPVRRRRAPDAPVCRAGGVVPSMRRPLGRSSARATALTRARAQPIERRISSSSGRGAGEPTHTLGAGAGGSVAYGGLAHVGALGRSDAEARVLTIEDRGAGLRRSRDSRQPLVPRSPAKRLATDGPR